MKTMKDGPESLTGPLESHDLEDWLRCYVPALAGAMAAQRKLPNPRNVARLADRVATEGVQCIRRRRNGHAPKR
jgi:hypothetical protein